MTRVLRLSDPRAQDVRLSGLRMSTMARLAADGLDVPPGFVVTTECGEWGDPEAEAAVFRGYDDLGDGHGGLPVVSARSSPASEDLTAPPGASFDTQRDISSLPELFSAIDACRGGPSHEQARPYYAGPPATFMAVGVLRSLPAELSGVTYTRCPLGTGRLVVETVRGALPPLLEGSVIPEHLELLPRQGRVAKRLVGEHGPELLDEALLALVRDASLHISELLSAEVGVEWAVVDGRLVVLQARAMGAHSRPAV